MKFKEAKQILLDKNIVDYFERGQRSKYYVYWSDGGYGKMNKDSIISHAKLYE
jgi:hypothetical protein